MDFIDEFSDVMEHCYARCAIVGDVNVHLENPRDIRTAAFSAEITKFDLSNALGIDNR